jgi:hypothetical protein
LLDGVKVLRTINGTTIGRKRIITFPRKAGKRCTFCYNTDKAIPVISEVEVYNINMYLLKRIIDLLNQQYESRAVLMDKKTKGFA